MLLFQLTFSSSIFVHSLSFSVYFLLLPVSLVTGPFGPPLLSRPFLCQNPLVCHLMCVAVRKEWDGGKEMVQQPPWDLPLLLTTSPMCVFTESKERNNSAIPVWLCFMLHLTLYSTVFLYKFFADIICTVIVTYNTHSITFPVLLNWPVSHCIGCMFVCLPQSAFCVACPIQYLPCGAGSCRKHTLLRWLTSAPPAPAAVPSGQAAVCHMSAACTYIHILNTLQTTFKMGVKVNMYLNS